MFADAAWVTCLTDDSDVDEWALVAGLALAVGSRVVPADPQAHDLAVARISHLPHLMALALAQAGEQGGALALSLAAGSFADGTRVAGTRPELIRAMTETNRNALIDAMDDALGILGVARGSLASTGSLLKITEAGHAARGRFERRGDQLAAVTLDGDELVDQLLAVGAAGGHVCGMERTAGGLNDQRVVPRRRVTPHSFGGVVTQCVISSHGEVSVGACWAARRARCPASSTWPGTRRRPAAPGCRRRRSRSRSSPGRCPAASVGVGAGVSPGSTGPISVHGV